jgi:hypothetical protein
MDGVARTVGARAVPFAAGVADGRQLHALDICTSVTSQRLRRS